MVRGVYTVVKNRGEDSRVETQLSKRIVTSMNSKSSMS